MPQPSSGRGGTNALAVRPALSYDNMQVNHTTAWYDPVNIEVNYLQSWVSYDFGPQDAGASNAYEIAWPYTASGWYVVSSNGSTTRSYNSIERSSTPISGTFPSAPTWKPTFMTLLTG